MESGKEQIKNGHRFHIPVMGLGFTIDTPIKVARFGISSVVSIMEDHLIENMRKFHSISNGLPYLPIEVSEDDYRAKRITAYLNLMQEIVEKQVNDMKLQKFANASDLSKYFELLPEDSVLKQTYHKMQNANGVIALSNYRNILINDIKPGSIDVNIMTKLDKTNYKKNGEALPQEYSDAMSALRGFAESNLNSSIIFSAGMNPRLFTYCEMFDDFYPNAWNDLKKRIVLKVSDFRSARIQGLFLAKKGLWVSEFRIESGLNCGGHAFATDGLLLGPILEEFKEKGEQLSDEMFTVCQQSLADKGKRQFDKKRKLRLSAQGGVGNANEQEFLLKHYNLDSIGWGSPFLLVPEACNLDDDSKKRIAVAKSDDYYLRFASPFGIPFNNLRNGSSEEQRKTRIVKNRPGSPCYKKFLSFNTEFGEMPICTASRQYQHLKIAQILSSSLSKAEQEKQIAEIEEKDCLCEGLGAPALLINGITPSSKLTAVALCPGPNLKYFKGSFSLKEMIDHIYGRVEIPTEENRHHMFINELELYLKYFEDANSRTGSEYNFDEKKKQKYFDNLERGIIYYLNIVGEIKFKYSEERDQFLTKILQLKTLVKRKVMEMPELKS